MLPGGNGQGADGSGGRGAPPGEGAGAAGADPVIACQIACPRPLLAAQIRTTPTSNPTVGPILRVPSRHLTHRAVNRGANLPAMLFDGVLDFGRLLLQLKCFRCGQFGNAMRLSPRIRRFC